MYFFMTIFPRTFWSEQCYLFNRKNVLRKTIVYNFLQFVVWRMFLPINLWQSKLTRSTFQQNDVNNVDYLLKNSNVTVACLFKFYKKGKRKFVEDFNFCKAWYQLILRHHKKGIPSNKDWILNLSVGKRHGT